MPVVKISRFHIFLQKNLHKHYPAIPGLHRPGLWHLGVPQHSSWEILLYANAMLVFSVWSCCVTLDLMGMKCKQHHFLNLGI